MRPFLSFRSPISTLPPYAYSPAKQSSSSYSKSLPDPSIVTVKEAFEQALSPTPPPASVMADFVNAFSSIGNDTLGEEQIPSNIGSRVNSMYEELHPGLRKTETGRSRSLSVDRVSESSDETIKKRVSVWLCLYDLVSVGSVHLSHPISACLNTCHSWALPHAL